MKVNLSEKEIKLIKNCLITIEVANSCLKIGDTTKLMNLFDKLDSIIRNSK